MPKRLSSRAAETILLKEGFVFISQRGSHTKFRKEKTSGAITVIVPMGKKEIPQGTLRSVIRQSGMPKEKFLGA